MEPESVPEEKAISPKNFFSRLGGVYFSPREAFQEIGGSPTILMPIIVLIVIGLLSGFYLTKTVDIHSIIADQQEQRVKQGSITKEQMEQQLPIAQKVTEGFILVSSAFGSLLISLAMAGFAKFFSSFASAENKFKAIFAATLYAVIAVTFVQSVLLVVVLQFKNPVDVDLRNINSMIASNLGALLRGILGEDALPRFVMSLASAVDIFAIWIISLLAIGYSAVSRKLKTATAATWLVVAYGIVAVAGAAFASFIGSSG